MKKICPLLRQNLPALQDICDLLKTHLYRHLMQDTMPAMLGILDPATPRVPCNAINTAYVQQ
jgi:hypothetical protein